jgi:predicted site-specific integrase-resolvase
MPINLNGSQYYRTNEACHMAGITKNTFFRWVSNGSIADVECRDRRGWRLFTESDLKSLIYEANRVQVHEERTTAYLF